MTSENDQPAARPRVPRVLQLLPGLLGLILYGLIVFSAFTDRGLFSFLLDWQIALFGAPNPQLLAVVTAVLLFFVLPLATDRFRRRLGLPDDLPAPPRVARLQPGTDEAMRRGIKRVASIGIGLYLTGAVLATSLQLYAGRNAGEPLPPVILTNALLTLPASTHWGVALQAMPLKSAIFTHRYAVRVAQYKDFYTPLVPANWAPTDKIQLMEKDSASVGEHDVWDEPNPPGPIRGYFRTGGPAPWIQRLYRQAGYQVGPWTVIVERSDIGPEIPAPNSDNAFFIIYMFGVTGSVFMIVALIASRRLRARAK